VYKKTNMLSNLLDLSCISDKLSFVKHLKEVINYNHTQTLQ